VNLLEKVYNLLFEKAIKQVFLLAKKTNKFHEKYKVNCASLNPLGLEERDFVNLLFID